MKTYIITLVGFDQYGDLDFERTFEIKTSRKKAIQFGKRKRKLYSQDGTRNDFYISRTL